MPTNVSRTADEYIASLPPERQELVRAIRTAVRDNLPRGYAEGMQYGMIGWYVPLQRFGGTNNGQPLGLAALASQKQYVSLYLNCVYSDPELERWFRDRWAQSGKTLNMGKSCVRFRRLDDVPLDVIGEVIARSDLDGYVARHQAIQGGRAVRKS